MATLHSVRNSWPVGTRSIFVQNLPEFFSLSREFSMFFLVHQLSYLQVFEQKSQNYIPVEILDQSEQEALSNKIFQNFLFIERIFPFFLGPLNILSASFGVKMPTLYSCQNFWLVGQMGIFLQTLPFFFLIEFSMCIWDHWIYYLHVLKQKWRHCILVKILDQSGLAAFSYKI